MAAEIKMPKLGMTMSEAKLVEWKAKEGDWIEKGSVVLTIETEKISWEVEAVASGFLHIGVKEGDIADVGATLGLLAENPEELKAVQQEGPASGEVPATTSSVAAAAAVEGQASPKNEFTPASPAARRMAKELGVDLSRVPGTGPGGRITEADVSKFHEEGPPPPRITPLALELARQAGLDISKIIGTGEGGKITKEDVKQTLGPEVHQAERKPYRSIPFTGMRGVIARNMYDSLRNTAQVTTFVEADVTGTVQYRELIREKYRNDDTVRVSYNDIVLLITSRVLKRFPIMNSTAVGGEILLHDSVNLGIAVALDNGLIVPVLRNADQKGILEISRESRELIRKAREGKLIPDELSEGTFTVTNIGVFNMDGGTPILRSPETGIMGVGRIKEKPVVHHGEICIRSMMLLSLTFDHRVVDGAPSSLFLDAIAQCLSQPMLIMS